jgi:hypothetical protein
MPVLVSFPVSLLTSLSVSLDLVGHLVINLVSQDPVSLVSYLISQDLVSNPVSQDLVILLVSLSVN